MFSGNAEVLRMSSRAKSSLISHRAQMARRGFVRVEVNVSNEELANEANVTIFTVSRLLSEWQRKGLLVKSRGRVVILSPEGLMGGADQIPAS